MGMTQRGDTRVRSRLDGICPMTYPTVKIEVAVTSWLPYIDKSSSMPLRKALLMLYRSRFLRKYPIWRGTISILKQGEQHERSTYRRKSEHKGIQLEQQPTLVFGQLPCIPDISLPGLDWLYDQLFLGIPRSSLLIPSIRSIGINIFLSVSHNEQTI